MTLDRRRMEERLQRIERKRETLSMLEGCLRDWEKELDSPDIPAEIVALKYKGGK